MNGKKILDYALGILTSPFALLGFVVGIVWSRFKDGLFFAEDVRDERYWR